MASPAMKVSLFLLLTLLSSVSTHARDSQFFNKIPSTTTNVVVPENKEAPNNQQEPNFLPQNENSYGLYGHESGQNPPSTVAATTTTTTPAATTPYTAEFKQPDHKYLPKNYNPVAYVTQPEDVNESPEFTEETSFATNPDNTNNGGEQNYYNNQQQQQQENAEFRSYPTTANNRDNYYYNGGSSFNTQPQGQIGDTGFRSGATTFSNRDSYFANGGGATNGFQPQGMSDTRLVENGKYFYDINSEKYSSNHPYESLRGARAQNEFDNRNFYGNNAYEFNGENSVGGYQNREEFQDEQNLP